jgi:hypothetical protein
VWERDGRKRAGRAIRASPFWHGVDPAARNTLGDVLRPILEGCRGCKISGNAIKNLSQPNYCRSYTEYPPINIFFGARILRKEPFQRKERRTFPIETFFWKSQLSPTSIDYFGEKNSKDAIT